MAKIKKGILGGISGTVGNVVGGNWRGIDYIRSKPSSVRNPNTEAQRAQRMRFRLVMSFLKKARPFITIGFRNGNQNQTEMNKAMSLNVREAISGTYPDLEIDPGALVISVGDLDGAVTAAVDFSVPQEATFTWSNDAAAGNASNDDAAMVLLFNSEKQAVSYKLHGASRVDETVTLAVPASWSGDTISGYLAFRSETGRDVSSSQFLGTETIS